MRAPILIGGCTWAVAVSLLFGACHDERDKGFSQYWDPTSSASSGAGGGPQPLDICPCIATWLDEYGDLTEPCLSCHDASVKPDSLCDGPQKACVNDTECSAIMECVATCNDEEYVDTDCIKGCTLPYDKDASTRLYHSWMTCMCELCTAECNTYDDMVCGEGGAGGTGGGAGGAGGAGGQGGSAGQGG